MTKCQHANSFIKVFTSLPELVDSSTFWVQCLLDISALYGGVFYSEKARITSRGCSYKMNKAASAGGVFCAKKSHTLYSENNTYKENQAPSGSLYMEIQGNIGAASENDYPKITLVSDHILNNIAGDGTLYTSYLSSMEIYTTRFKHNTALDNLAGIFIENFVQNFSCIKCIFMRNKAEFDGVISIKYGAFVTLEYLSVVNNAVASGEIVQIKESLHSMITSSHFMNNFCSGAPCALSVTNSKYIEVESCLFTNLPMNDTSVSVQTAVNVEGNHVTIKKIILFGMEGNVLKGTAVSSMTLQNITNSCPARHYFLASLIPYVTRSNGSFGQENGHSLIMNCILCAENHYRLGISSYSFQRDRESNSLLHTFRQTDACYRCPTGGICERNYIVADANYWGFIDGDEVSFEFCSLGHCCQTRPCSSYDTCNEGRDGKLCTSCKDGFQLGVVEDECILSGKCVEGWIYLVIIISGLVYVGTLFVKVEILNVLLIIYEKCIASCNRVFGKGLNYHHGIKKQSVSGETLEKQSAEKPKERKVKSSIEVNYQNIKPIKNEDQNLSKSWEIPCDSVEIFHLMIYHLQDTRLFQIRFPDMPSASLSLGEYRDKKLSFIRLDSLAFTSKFACLGEGKTQVTKLLVNISVIPYMIFIFFICVLLLKISRIGHQIKNRLMSSAYKVILLIVLFSSQQLSTTALNLVNCVWLGSGNYLRIDTTVKCYQPWQGLAFVYLLLFIFPLWITIFIASGLLRNGIISVRTYLLAMIFPGPFLLYIAIVSFKKRKDMSKEIYLCHDITSDAILDEVWYSYRPFTSYPYLCWGGLVELRRLTLVLFATLISSAIAKTMCMTSITLFAFLIHFTFRPYSDATANHCANISLFATILVGMVNIGWASVLYTGSGFAYDIAWKIGEAMATLEIALVEMVPLGIFLFCCGQTLWVNLSRKGK